LTVDHSLLIIANIQSSCSVDRYNYIYGPILFLWGQSHLYSKNISTVSEETAMLTCKMSLIDSPHPVIVKVEDFEHFISLDGVNSVFFV